MNKQNWFPEIYNKLNKRANSFDILIFELENLNRPVTILETGCARFSENWDGDGMSTLIWDKLVNSIGGIVYSVDIDSNAVKFAKNLVSEQTLIHCGDSVEFLNLMSTTGLKIDLLYLDSYDIDWNNPEPSMQHHKNELDRSIKMLSKGSIVAVDDNLPDMGKGHLVGIEAEKLGWTPIINQYIRAWKV